MNELIILSMEKNILAYYTSPAIRVITMKFDGALCLSGNHEGTSEEDWSASSANIIIAPEDIDSMNP